MAQQLMNMYAEAERLGSLAAKMKLAMLTKISSTKAVDLPDSRDVIELFESAMQQVRNEFKKQ